MTSHIHLVVKISSQRRNQSTCSPRRGSRSNINWRRSTVCKLLHRFPSRRRLTQPPVFHGNDLVVTGASKEYLRISRKQVFGPQGATHGNRQLAGLFVLEDCGREPGSHAAGPGSIVFELSHDGIAICKRSCLRSCEACCALLQHTDKVRSDVNRRITGLSKLRKPTQKLCIHFYSPLRKILFR